MIQELSEHKEGDLKEIKDATDFNSLYLILNEMGEVEGSDGSKYSSLDLQERIEKARTESLGLKLQSVTEAKVANIIGEITRTGGLRDKVRDLIYREVQERG
jgi:RNA processing factor Prp31